MLYTIKVTTVLWGLTLSSTLGEVNESALQARCFAFAKSMSGPNWIVTCEPHYTGNGGTRASGVGPVNDNPVANPVPGPQVKCDTVNVEAPYDIRCEMQYPPEGTELCWTRQGGAYCK